MVVFAYAIIPVNSVLCSQVAGSFPAITELCQHHAAWIL